MLRLSGDLCPEENADEDDNHEITEEKPTEDDVIKSDDVESSSNPLNNSESAQRVDENSLETPFGNEASNVHMSLTIIFGLF